MRGGTFSIFSGASGLPLRSPLSCRLSITKEEVDFPSSNAVRTASKSLIVAEFYGAVDEQETKDSTRNLTHIILLSLGIRNSRLVLCPVASKLSQPRGP